MGENQDDQDCLPVWCEALSGFVSSDAPDLSTRQLAIVLNVYVRPGPHTVRGLAEALNISKPAVSRALDALGTRGLTRRHRDTKDRRNVLVEPTEDGAVFMGNFAGLVQDAQATVKGTDG